MTPHFKSMLGGFGLVAAAICALPMPDGFGAAPIATPPSYQVNRAVKGDRLVAPAASIARKITIERIQQAPRAPDETAKNRPIQRKLMEGCEPAFSPVTVPSMAHLSGRCVA